MTIHPVYCFEGYANRVDLFHAFDSSAALDFALDAGNRYLAVSREVACCALTGRPFAVNERDMAGRNMNPYRGA